MPKKLKGPFGIFQHFCRKTQKKVKGGPFEVIANFPKKVSQCRNKTEKGTLWDFSTSILTQNIKK